MNRDSVSEKYAGGSDDPGKEDAEEQKESEAQKARLLIIRIIGNALSSMQEAKSDMRP